MTRRDAVRRLVAALTASGAAVAAGAAAGCGTEQALVPPGTTVTKSAGDSATVVVGGTATISVVVLDGSGQPLAGIRVSWSVVSGGGSVQAGTATGADGVASASYSVGTTTGQKLLTASVAGAAGSPVTFTLTAVPGPPRRLVRASGDQQTAVAGDSLPAPLVVTVVDTYGNGVPGIEVFWSVTAGNGAVNPATSTSDSLGNAATTLVTSPPAGDITVAASSGGLALAGSPITFTATSTIQVTLVKLLPIANNYGLHDQFVRDGLAFLCAWNTGLLIYDVGNGIRGGSPANPQLVSSVITHGGSVHNAWWYHSPTGEHRYVFVGQEGPGSIGSSSSGDIHVVDIANVAQPVEVDSFHLAGAGTHNFWVDEQNQILYAAYYNGGVVALDVSGTLDNVLQGRQIARIQPGGAGNTYVWGVQLANGSLYATDMLSGFWQLRLVGGAFQILGGGNNVPERYGSDQWVAGGYAYSGTWGGLTRNGNRGNALKIWRLDAGGAPVLADSIVVANIGTVSDVEVSADGKLLMFSTESGSGAGLYFYSLVSDPAHPTLLGRYPVTDNSNRGVHTATFAEIGGRRYVFAAKDPDGSGLNSALLILDVTSLGP